MNLMTSHLSSTKRQIMMAMIMLLGFALNSCKKNKFDVPVNVGTIRFAANAYLIENNTIEPLTVVMPLSLPLEQEATVIVKVDAQSTIAASEYTVDPAIPAEGLKLTIPKGSTEISFKVSSLNNFEGEKTLVLTLASASGGLSVASVNPSTVINVKGNPIIVPEVRTSQTEIAFGNVITNTISPSKSYTLTGVKLTADVVITASANFEVSLDDITYTKTLTIPFATANTTPITINTRFIAKTNANQTVAGTITHTSGTLPPAVISLTGVEYGVAAPGVLLRKDDFSYGATAVKLTTASASAWLAFSQDGVNPVLYTPTGLSFTGYTGSGIGGAAVMENKTAAAEDISWTFPEQTSGVIYSAQLLNLSAAPTSADFFMSLGNLAQGTTPTYYNRIYAKANGSQYNLGVSRNANTTPAYLTNNLDYGTTYLIVTKYEFVTGNSSMYIITGAIPAVEPLTPNAVSNGGAVDPTSMTRITIRQNTSISLKATIDGLRIATSWKEAVGL